MSERVAALLPVDDRLLAAHPEVFGSDPAARSVALAEAFTASPAWGRLRDGVRCVVRPATGLIGLIGTVSAEDQPLVEQLGGQVSSLLERLTPFPYPAVEAACADAAIAVRDALPPDVLEQAHLAPIPRGGLIVAGLLSYALDLPIAGPVSGASAPLIVVDDCSLSGRRLGQTLSRLRGRVVAVVLLHAHPDLARRVEQDEGIACIVARPLVDHAPGRPGYEEWLSAWRERSPDDYWSGDPDHVCYPWNEPDSLIWNPVTERAEAAWRVVPPAWCVKSRTEAHPEDLVVCEAADGPIRPAHGVLWTPTEEGMIVAGLGLGAPVVLRGAGADLWRALVETGDLDAAAGRVAREAGVDAGVVREDLARLVDQLSARGMVQTDPA